MTQSKLEIMPLMQSLKKGILQTILVAFSCRCMRHSCQLSGLAWTSEKNGTLRLKCSHVAICCQSLTPVECEPRPLLELVLSIASLLAQPCGNMTQSVVPAPHHSWNSMQHKRQDLVQPGVSMRGLLPGYMIQTAEAALQKSSPTEVLLWAACRTASMLAWEFGSTIQIAKLASPWV